MEGKKTENKITETKTFSTDFIKEKIKSLLGSVKAVKEIKNIEIKGNGNEIKLTLEITGKKSIVTVDIDANMVLENKGNGIAVKNHQINASKFQGIIEETIAPELSKIPERIKSYIEKEQGKKVDKIEIVNGELKVTFGEAIEAPSEKVEPSQSNKPSMRVNLSPDTDLNRKIEKDIAEDKKIEEGKEKVKKIKELFETIENSKKIIEENKIKREALLKELAELNTEPEESKITIPKISPTPEGKPKKTEKDIEKEIENLEREIDIKLKELKKINLLNPFNNRKFNKLDEEINTLRKLRSQKYEQKKELYELENIKREKIQKESEGLEKEKEEREEQERIKTIEEDKKINPFKYFMIKEMKDDAFLCIFLKKKEEVSLKDIDYILGEDGKEIGFFDPEYVLENRGNTVEYSSNGFTLQLQNKEEVRGENGINFQDLKARYKLVTPDWKYIRDDLGYEEGVKLLKEEAEKYQAEITTLFNKQNTAK